MDQPPIALTPIVATTAAPPATPPRRRGRHRRSPGTEASPGSSKGSGGSAQGSGKSETSGESSSVAMPRTLPTRRNTRSPAMTLAMPPMPVFVPRRPVLRQRATGTNDLVMRAGLSPMPAVASAPVTFAEPERTTKPKPNLFGMHTDYKPFYLLAMGAAGNWLYGTGTVAIERGFIPRRPLAPPGSASKLLPPQYQPLFGSKQISLGLGFSSTVAGAGLALLSCGLFYQDARRLARKQNPAHPSYLRPNIYLGAHLAGILLSVAYKFLSEALRDITGRDYTWAAAVPGNVGQALFAVTQAQAFSGCEVQNGRMPLKHRGAIGFAARCTVGTYALYGVLNGIPYLNSYGKEVVRLVSVTASTLAYSLPLTTARIGRREGVPVPGPSETPQDSWHALQVLGIYFAGRAMAGYGPDLLQRGVVAGIAPNQEPGVVGNVFGGASLLSIGTGLCAVAIMAFRQDVAAYNRKKANTWAAIAFGALLLIEAYRGMLEYGITTRSRSLMYVSCLPGVVGAGLRFAVLPELFVYAELLHGDLPLKYRYHWTESCRGAAQLLFGIWGATCAVPGFNPFVRETLGVSAGILATLGMALPTTTSRRVTAAYPWPLSPGATPGSQHSNVEFPWHVRAGASPSN